MGTPIHGRRASVWIDGYEYKFNSYRLTNRCPSENVSDTSQKGARLLPGQISSQIDLGGFFEWPGGSPLKSLDVTAGQEVQIDLYLTGPVTAGMSYDDADEYGVPFEEYPYFSLSILVESCVVDVSSAAPVQVALGGGVTSDASLIVV